MYDIVLEIVHAIMKNGLSLSALGTALFVLLKQRKVKRALRKRLPWLLRDDSDVLNYEARQIRIEAKIDALMSAQEVTWDAEKNDSSISTEKKSSISSWAGKSSVHIADAYTAKESTTTLRGNREMKEYLKKLGRTKFQAFLLATFTNIGLLIGYLMNVNDVQSEVSAYTPLFIGVSQLVAGMVYQWVEGSIDKAKVKAEVKDEEFKTSTEHFE
ncbi:hypothetical protein [Cohnella sp. GCM10027633]|uniref:hypothetical protein n=1 Tax=unclassified Cohnella TaxID=2636738 RepID=UPI00363AD71E